MPDVPTADCRLAAEPTSVRAARRLVSEAVGDVLEPSTLDGVLLATSEVVTNAIEHGAPPIDLRVEQDDAHLRIEVRDGSCLPPRTRTEQAGPAEVRGRGMTIVDRCSDRWGIEPSGSGKSVWFEVDLR